MIFFLYDKEDMIQDTPNNCFNDNLFVLVYGVIIITMYLITLVYLSYSLNSYAKYNKDRKETKDGKYYEDTILYKILRYVRGDGKGTNEVPMMDARGKKKIPREYDTYGIHEATKVISVNYTLMITLMSLIVLHFIFYLVVKYIVKSNICSIDIQLYGKVFLIAMIPIIITLISTTEFYNKKFKDLLNSLKSTNRSISNINRVLVTNITTNREFLNALTANDSLTIIEILDKQTNPLNLKRLFVTHSIYSSIINSIDASSTNIQEVNAIFRNPNNTLSADLVPYLKIGLNIDNIFKEYRNSLTFDKVYRFEATREQSIEKLESTIDVTLENITDEIAKLNNKIEDTTNKYMISSLIFNIFMLILVVIVIIALLKTIVSQETLQWIFNKLKELTKQSSNLLILIIPIILIVILTK